RPVIQLVLDADLQVHAGAGSHSSREWAIRIAASLAQGWLQTGAQVGAVWNGQAIPAASGPQQLHRLLDSLARLPQMPGPDLSECLASPACRGFRDGLQVIVTTDTALARIEQSYLGRGEQHWVVLRSAAFSDDPSTAFTPSAG